MRFGVSGDGRGELAPYPAIINAPERELQFFVEHGHTIYADFPSDAVKNHDETRKKHEKTIEEYRAKHGEVYGDRFGINTWADLRAVTSVLATIDDHEVINDFAGGAPAETDPRFPEDIGITPLLVFISVNGEELALLIEVDSSSLSEDNFVIL